MKKFLTVIATLALCLACALGVAGCNKNDGGKYAVYAPDGAPALSLAALAKEDNSFNVNFVKAETINAYVTGAEPKADFAVLPVNAAVKLLGSGEQYKMLGTVTHGNLYLLKKQGGEDISSASDLSKLVGKTVGVINLANVPGLTLKVILKDNNLTFNELKDGASPSAEAVNLKAVEGLQVLPTNSDCDYFIVPEPAASTRVAVTQNKLSFAGNLQTLYGGQSGYPQAVAVVKASVAESDKNAVNDFVDALKDTWITNENTSANDIVEVIRSHYLDDGAPTFTAANLTKAVIANCGIAYESNASCKTAVLAFMEKLNAVSASPWGTPADSFFYTV